MAIDGNSGDKRVKVAPEHSRFSRAVDEIAKFLARRAAERDHKMELVQSAKRGTRKPSERKLPE